VSSVLLLDLDHTLYPSTAPTLPAVDARITSFIETRLALPSDLADQMRRDLCAEHGTTLRGLEILHGVSRDEYTDYIQDLGDHLMPDPDPRLREWLIAAAAFHPTYIFTNARRDWAHRCLERLGLSDLHGDMQSVTGETQAKHENDAGGDSAAGRVFGDILDIDFMGWAGKPQPSAFEKVEAFLRARHPGSEARVFADDRLDNLAAARARGWRTVWVRPHDAPRASLDAGAGHRVVDSLLELDPGKL
jgi:putative hydrolase of the HAD superfamily